MSRLFRRDKGMQKEKEDENSERLVKGGSVIVKCVFTCTYTSISTSIIRLFGPFFFHEHSEDGCWLSARRLWETGHRLKLTVTLPLRLDHYTTVIHKDGHWPSPTLLGLYFPSSFPKFPFLTNTEQRYECLLRATN